MSNICSKQRQEHTRFWLLFKQRRRLGVVACTAVWSKAPRSRFHGCQLAPLSLSDQSDLEEVVAARAHESDILPLFWCLRWPPWMPILQKLVSSFSPALEYQLLVTAVVAAFFRACPAFQALPLAWGFLMIRALLAACALPLSTSRPLLLCRLCQFLSTGLRSVDQKMYRCKQPNNNKNKNKLQTNDENTPTPLITLRTCLSSREAAWALIGRHARLHAQTIGAALSRPCYLRWRALQQMKVNTVGTPRSF